eukprot:250479-Pelagomonas_calceolata.AAC.3
MKAQRCALVCLKSFKQNAVCSLKSTMAVSWLILILMVKHLLSRFCINLAASIADIACRPYTFRQMLSWALEPADDEVLVWLMEKGKRDSLTWSAQRKGGLEAPAPEPTLVLPGSSIVEEP